jgi:hypothetical protein
MGVAVPDPVDAHLLALVAEVGRVAVHDLARRAGMDVREVAARLAGLAAGGLPLVVGVECDPTALWHVLNEPVVGASWSMGPYGAVPTGPPSGPQPVPGHPWPGQPWHPSPGQPGYAGQPGHAGHLGPGPSRNGPPAGFGPSHGTPPHGAPPHGTPPHGAPHGQPARASQPAGLDAAGTWGPPGSAAWARGDELATTVRTTPERPAVTAQQRTGAIGDTLHTDPTDPTDPTDNSDNGDAGDAADGPEGPRLAIRLAEVLDPADFLFTAAGYRLRPGERSVVVHTEVTNNGRTPYPVLPDLYLVLLDADGNAVPKAPVALSSRPPHRMGVKPGEAAGGHTVYVLPESTELAAVRWSARPDDEREALTWSVWGTT